MTAAEVAVIIGAVGTFISSTASAFISLRNSRKIDSVHDATNSKMDRLLAVTGAAEKAKGIQEGLQQAQDAAKG